MKNKGQNKNMEMIKKTLLAKVKDVNNDEGIIRAVFSSGKPDRQGEIIDQASWKLNEYMTNPIVLFTHDHTQPAIGKVLEIGINAEGMLEGLIQFAIKEYEFARTLFNLYKGKFMRAFSVGFVSEDQEDVPEGMLLKNNTLYELSAVNIPADVLALAKSKGMDISWTEKKKTEKSPACGMADETKKECVARKIPKLLKEDPEMEQDQAVAIANSICDKQCEKKSIDGIQKTEEKGVIPFKEYPTADENTNWNGPKEISDASVEDLKKMCAWYDSENSDTKSSYKLPHHQASDYRVVWKGVSAAMAALLGARGGVKIPDSDKKGVYNHLAKHYKQFDKEVPDFKNIEGYRTKEGRVLSMKNREIIKKAKWALEDVLTADQDKLPKSDEEKDIAKYNFIKNVNKAVRALLETKKNR